MSRASSAISHNNCFPALLMTEKLFSSTRNRTVASPSKTRLPAGLPGANSVAALLADECTSRSSYHFNRPVDNTKKRRTGSRLSLRRKFEATARIVRKPLRLLGTAHASFLRASTSRGAWERRTETSSRAAAAQPMKSMAEASTSSLARSRASKASACTSKKPVCDVVSRLRQCFGASCGASSPIEAFNASLAEATPANLAATNVMLMDAAANGNGPSNSFSHVCGWCSSPCKRQCSPRSLCGNQISGAPRGGVFATASARWRGGSMPWTRVVPVTASARWRGGSQRSPQ